jgi:hypothetical protein
MAEIQDEIELELPLNENDGLLANTRKVAVVPKPAAIKPTALQSAKRLAKEETQAELKAQKKNKPNIRSKIFQTFICFQTYVRMAETGKVMTTEAQEVWALKMYTSLAEDFVTKSGNSIFTGDLYAVMTEYHVGEFTLNQMMKAKGDELLTGKSVIARGKASKLKVETAIACTAVREELKKNAKVLRPATGEEDADEEVEGMEEPTTTFTNDSGDADGSLFIVRIVQRKTALMYKISTATMVGMAQQNLDQSAPRILELWFLSTS